MLDITDTSNAKIVENSPDWKTAVQDLVSYWIAQSRCFSSGEVAAALRVHRTDLRFSVPRVGEMLRDLVWSQAFPLYGDDGQGGGEDALQVSRFTTGRFPDRTPAQTEVFVYGPDQDACEEHEFEVFIPKPGETMADAPTPAVSMPSSTTGSGSVHAQAAILIFGAKVATQDIKATVWPDERLAVPRSAFEALCHMSGTPIRAGDKVHVKVTPGDKAVITLCDDGSGDCRAYSPVKDAGRVAFNSGDDGNPFPVGTHYSVKVDDEAIVVDLSNPC